MSRFTPRFLTTLTLGVIIMFACSLGPVRAVTLPDPALDTPVAAAGAPDQTLTLAGGCFWGIQAVFQHVKGVKQAISGYSGGTAETAQYNTVATRQTDHAESVQVTYDPSQVTLGKLLKVFFSVAHNPTELDRQGPDTGPEYRSAIFVASPEQEKISTAYIAQLNQARVFDGPIVTKLEPFKAFYPAESYNQDFARLNPNNPYILYNDAPKVVALQKTFPELYVNQ